MTTDRFKPTVFVLITILVYAVAAFGQANRKAGREAVSINPVPSANREPLFATRVITYASLPRDQAKRSPDKANTNAAPAPSPIAGKRKTANANNSPPSLQPILIVYRTFSSPIPIEKSGQAETSGSPARAVENDTFRKSSATASFARLEGDKRDTTPSNVEATIALTEGSLTPHAAAFDERTLEVMPKSGVLARPASAVPNPIPDEPALAPPPLGGLGSTKVPDLIAASIDPLATDLSSPSPFFIEASDAVNSSSSVAKNTMTAAVTGPVDVVELNNLAVQSTLENRYGEAEALLHKAIEAQPRIAKFHRNLSILFERMGRLDKALESARTAANLSPGDASVVERLCTIEFDSHNWTAAIGCYEKLGSIQPLDGLSGSDYGMALLRAGKTDRSLEVLQKAAGSDPPVAVAMNSLGIAYFELQRFDDAAAIFKRAVETAPDNFEFRYNLAVTQLSLRNRESAISQYNILKTSDPKLASRLYQMLFSEMIVVVPKN
jgi:tetratricopeptide (TPR) repeat protein